MQYPGIPRIVIEGLRAAFLLLEDDALNPPMNAPDFSQQLSESLTNSLTAHVIAAISPQVAAVLSASELIKTKAEELAQMKLNLMGSQDTPNAAEEAAQRAERAADAVLYSISDVKTAMDLLTPSLSATQSSIDKMSTQPTPNQTGPTQIETVKSYSAAVQ
ncbi:hypothetical protein DEU56DRAFT_755445 [Suillus clintonianus]|uniref:uncharacterized protein n=1 Tax=Suillus clintonianus TaxID=1904413 RepID=UPI001B85C060|nr:uncharacterized protein DEU56DRAFT_755445 [Suillus clintonianus]KAG2139673.1 hypothetical protein DEU56DRAFT_755445 [Suillus clintonianus]